MAATVQIGGNGTLFLGEDKQLMLELIDVNSVPVDMTGFTMVIDIRLRDNAPVALLSYTPSLTGAYNVVRSVNTQRAVVNIPKADTLTLQAPPGSGKVYRWSWKRLDSGSATELAVGNFVIQVATSSQD